MHHRQISVISRLSLPHEPSPAYCPRCRAYELDLRAGVATCPDCGTPLVERRTVAGRAFTLTAGSGLDLVLTLRMVLTRTWGGELLAALLAISIATLLTDVWPLPFGVFAGALAGGAFLGMSLSQGIRVYACVTAVLAVALCLSDPLSMPGLFLECFYAATWLVAAHAVDQAIRESTGG